MGIKIIFIVNNYSSAPKGKTGDFDAFNRFQQAFTKLKNSFHS